MFVALPRPETDANKKPKGLGGEYQVTTADWGVSHQADWVVQGAVLDVHAEREEITFWLNSFNKPQTVPIVPAMPGWLLRSDVKFIAKVPATEVRSRKLTGKFWGRFEPEQFTYLNQVETARMVNAMMRRNREARK